MEERYGDILDSMKKKPETRTAGEIINSISNKLQKMSEE